VRLKARLLVQSVGAVLALTLLLSAVLFVSIERIRTTVFRNSAILGDSAAYISAYMLEVLHTEKIKRTAIDTVLLLDERLGRIESHTRMAADIAGSAYVFGRYRGSRPLPLVAAGEIPPPEPYLYVVPGVSPPDVLAEAELLGGVAETLRQITVVDWNIAVSSVNSESGFVIAMDAFPWVKTDCDPRASRWYSRVRDTGKPFWTDVYLDPRVRVPVISHAVPFFDRSSGRDAFMGVARSAVRLSDFSRIIDPTGIRRSGQFFVLNRDGTVVYSTDGVEVTTDGDGLLRGENFLESDNPRLRSLGLSMTLGATGMTELEWDGIPFYVAYAPIRTLGWSLGVTVPAREISVPVAEIEGRIWEITEATRVSIDRYIALLVGLIAALLFLILSATAFLAVRFTKSITGPVLALSDGVREVAGGNLNREVIVETGDELERLAASFNVMTSQLRDHIDEIALATAEKQRMDTELDVATRIQASMLPTAFPPFRDRKNDFELYAEVHPAREVGGDFYDFFFVDDDRFAIVVADVSGKGIPAALFMATAKTVIKNQLQSLAKPEPALEAINRELCDNNAADMFVTAWIGLLEISSRRLTYVNAGHTPPMLRRRKGNAGGGGNPGFEYLVSPPDLVLAGLDDTRYNCRRTSMDAGDVLFLYTDGVFEATNRDGEFYGKKRMKAFLDAYADRPLRETLRGLRSDIGVFADGAEQSDDITLLALRICPGPTPETGNAPEPETAVDAPAPAETPGAKTGANTPEPEPPPAPALTADSARAAPRRLTLKADVCELGTLTAFLRGELDAAGCPDRERRQVELASEELFVNIAKYAFRDDQPETGAVRVDCQTRAGGAGTEIAVVFRDRGRPFNPLEHGEPDVTLPAEEREAGGLGILIVRKIVDTIYYSCENGANRLEFTKSWRNEGI